jgi:ASC-1-like (ASCH) protein
MNYSMKLHPAPFEMIKSGKKTFELRLYDEKRQKIKVGDEIIFTNTVNGETLSRTVKDIHGFDSFYELYQSLPLLKCGYTEDDINSASPLDMERYYSIDEQKNLGVVGIELIE